MVRDFITLIHVNIDVIVCNAKGHLAVGKNFKHNLEGEQNPVELNVYIEKTKFNFGLDTGSSLSVFSKCFWKQYLNMYILQ